jgi:hypothetical protein
MTIESNALDRMALYYVKKTCGENCSLFHIKDCNFSTPYKVCAKSVKAYFKGKARRKL